MWKCTQPDLLLALQLLPDPWLWVHQPWHWWENFQITGAEQYIVFWLLPKLHTTLQFSKLYRCVQSSRFVLSVNTGAAEFTQNTSTPCHEQCCQKCGVVQALNYAVSCYPLLNCSRVKIYVIIMKRKLFLYSLLDMNVVSGSNKK